jgi:hypothetical protein
MNTQEYGAIQSNTSSKGESEQTPVPANREAGAHVPVNHLDFDATKSKYWNKYYQ